MPEFKFAFLRSMKEVSPAAWDALSPGTVLTSHAWLSALEDSGLVGPGKTLEYRIPALTDAAGNLAAAAPGVLKRKPLGEFGPEHLWTREAAKRGISLLPKLQLEVPPVGFPVPKFLVRPDLPHAQAAQLLLRAVIDATRSSKLQALTLSRMALSDEPAARAHQLVTSCEIGTLWRNEGYANYDEFLARFKSDYRVAIRAERKAFRSNGFAARELRGSQITAAHWDAFFKGYAAVCRKLHSPLQLNREFFDRLASLGDAVWLFGVFSGNQLRSGSYAVQSGDTLYGGHWAELEFTPNAVFEVGLYRSVEVAIELGLQAVDQGGWGPHKPKRGFTPVVMPNAHWIRDPGVRASAVRLAAEHRKVFDAYNTPSWDARYLRVAA